MAQTESKSTNLLFSSVGRRVELIRAFKRAYQSLAVSGYVVASDIDPLAPGLQVADRSYIVPRINSPDFIPALLRLCEREAISVVFPLIDPEIPILAASRDAFESIGTRVAVVSPESAEVCADKWSTVEFFKEIGLRTPLSWLPSQVAESMITYPAFIKPRRGSAGHDTFKIRHPHELQFFSNYIEQPIIQEFLPGPEITNDVICDLEGEVLAVVSRRRIEVRWGEVAKGETVFSEEICQACVCTAKSLNAKGPITVQCIMKDGVPFFTEINARLGGGVPLGIAAGVDSPAYLLARISGLPMSIPPIGSYRTGLYITRFDDSFFINGPERDRISSRRI